MTSTNRIRLTVSAVLVFLLGFGISEPLMAQPVSEYERLAQQNNQPDIFVDVFTLPGNSDNELRLTAIFHLSNNFLPFKKLNSPSRSEEFFSTATLSMEVFQSPRKNLKPSEEVDVDGLESVARATWSDTAFAANYEKTQSNDEGINGSMQVTVPPGHYTYFLKLQQQDQNRTRNSRTRNIHVEPYSNQHRRNIIYVDEVDDPQNPSRLTLVNMGSNVPFGKDFHAFVHLPKADSSSTYSLKIDRVKTSRNDTTTVGNVIKQEISPVQIMHNIHPNLTKSGDQVALDLQEKQNGHTYALLKIPNSRFSNAMYRITVTNSQNSRVARGLYQSYWSDMPTGLLSLDVAIDLLRFITDDKTIDRIDDGSDQERERKFREFWDKKDPTPNTEYNELQAEYYERIDYAYENFGSQKTLGFNTDRGRIYINYGPPNDIERTFPTDGPTTEIWTYDNRKFVFQATTGFGDFKLISK